jgi:protein-tyrosine-phosphatase
VASEQSLNDRADRSNPDAPAHIVARYRGALPAGERCDDLVNGAGGNMGRNIEEFELLNTRSQLRRAAMHAFDYYRGAIPLPECQAVVEESYELLGRTAVIKHHLVALADRWSIERLRRIGILGDRLGRTAPDVLFVDGDDAGLAAAAAALLAGYARGRVLASSAGHRPAPGLDPTLTRVAAERDLDLSDAFPKAVTAEAVHAADALILLGDVSTPTIDPPAAGRADGPAPRIERWELELPHLEDQTDEVVSAALDDLDVRVLVLLAGLLSTRRLVTDSTGSSTADG